MVKRMMFTESRERIARVIVAVDCRTSLMFEQIKKKMHVEE